MLYDIVGQGIWVLGLHPHDEVVFPEQRMDLLDEIVSLKLLEDFLLLPRLALDHNEPVYHGHTDWTESE